MLKRMKNELYDHLLNINAAGMHMDHDYYDREVDGMIKWIKINQHHLWMINYTE